MAGREITQEELVAIRKGARSGKTAQQVADDLERPVGTIRSVALRHGWKFQKIASRGPRGPYSEERIAAQLAGQQRAKARREGFEA